MRALLKFFVHVYRWTLSPFLGGQCRFHPTCSEYALECLETMPTHRAFLTITKRLLSCHPFHRGGYDPVPEARSSS